MKNNIKKEPINKLNSEVMIRMVNCQNCGQIIKGNFLICTNCFKGFIQDEINTLKPSKLADCSTEDIFPDAIYAIMNDFIRKDINDLLNCLYYELWNPTVLMCARILESSLKTHIEIDLKRDDGINNIGQCIEILRAEKYNQPFLELLEELRNLRNDAMHGTKRFGAAESLRIAKKVLHIVGWIFNIPVEPG
jgi:hypothetical protein